MRRGWFLGRILLACGLALQGTSPRVYESPQQRAAARECVDVLAGRPQTDAWLLATLWCRSPQVCSESEYRVLVDRLLADPPAQPGALRILIG